MDGEYDYLYKILLIGENAVGKTCILRRFVEDKYKEEHYGTIGVDFKVKFIQLEGKRIKLQLWDTPGGGRHGHYGVTASYYRGARGFIVVYDVTDQESFDNIQERLQDVDRYGSKHALRLLIGNKCDITAKRKVDYLTAKKFADQLGISYFEVNSKNGTNVEQAFMALVTDIMDRWRLLAPAHDESRYSRNQHRMRKDTSKQEGILNSIAGSFYDYFGFARDASSGKRSNSGRSNEYETARGEKTSDKESVLQASKDKGIKILLDDLMKLFVDEQMSDTVLKVNGQPFKVHKAILIARSPVFAIMFQHDMAEKNTNVVDIPDCTAESFEVFLHYIYSGSTEKLSVSNICGVYYAADKYQIGYLKEKCLELMIENTSVEMFYDIITLAVLHEESTLQKAAEDFFCQNAKEIIKTVKWQNFLAENYIVANELFNKALKD